MKRRKFLKASAASTAALALGATPHERQQEHPAIARLESLKPEEPPPISEPERAERRAKAQRLMMSANIHALLVEPGPSLDYFAGIRWGRSERLFAMLLPQRGEAIFISPAFEKERAASQIRDRFRIRAWEEDESPYVTVGNIMRDWGSAYGKIVV
jgi:Xaa-Pro dipeptidase